jgi:L-threonylcarbamoyladenylate synthase
MPQTLILSVSPDGEQESAIERAAALLREGKLVAFPTETVYGLGADATNPSAVATIFAAKERSASDPLIVHIADLERLSSVVAETPPLALQLAERFWPGPLTLVLPRAEAIPLNVTAGGPTVGVRMPASLVALMLIRAAGVPVAAPSANRFMRTSPTTAAHVLADLDGRIDCVLDGGPCAVGVESTVLDLTTTPPRILRPGAVTLEALREVAPEIEGPATIEAGALARAPGQMERHYAPRTPLIVFAGQDESALAAIRAEAEAALAQGKRVGALLPDHEISALDGLDMRVESLGPDPAAISRNLYAALRALDGGGLDLLLTHTYDDEGLGLALNDRLRRAAGGSLRSVDEEKVTTMHEKTLPGTPSHQAALGALTAYYASDPRVLAFSLFGSLARGDWDEYSDLDLDVILGDDVLIGARQEAERLTPVLEAVGERTVLILPRGQGSVDLVLLPLLEISIRYHALVTTSPNIVESAIVLTGPLTTEQVRAAGLANAESDETAPSELLDACVRYALEVGIAIRRGELWLAVELLHRQRGMLMELFVQSRSGGRPTQTFEAQADPALQARLGATLPMFDPPSMWRAHQAMLDLLEQDIPAFADGQAQLSAGQREVLSAIRDRESAGAQGGQGEV